MYWPPPPRRSLWRGLLSALLLTAPFLLVLYLLGSFFGTLTGGDAGVLLEEHHSLARLAPHKIAIVSIEGAILDGEGFAKRQIDAIREDQSVRAVVLRIDSPGGSVTASDYIYHHLRKLADEKKIPFVVSMGGMAASGGYYIAMAAGDTPDIIFAEPTTWTGSIGVIIPHYNVAGLMQRFEVEEDSIKSHPLKQMGSPTRKMTEEERQLFQELVDDAFTRFKEIVRSGRTRFREHPEALDALATGQVFTTNQALENGLVDREGFIEEAIDRAIELAQLDREQVEVIQYQRPFGLFDGLLLFGEAEAPPPSAELKALLDLTTPRAYYLCTWLPSGL